MPSREEKIAFLRQTNKQQGMATSDVSREEKIAFLKQKSANPPLPQQLDPQVKEISAPEAALRSAGSGGGMAALVEAGTRAVGDVMKTPEGRADLLAWPPKINVDELEKGTYQSEFNKRLQERLPAAENYWIKEPDAAMPLASPIISEVSGMAMPIDKVIGGAKKAKQVTETVGKAIEKEGTEKVLQHLTGGRVSKLNNAMKKVGGSDISQTSTDVAKYAAEKGLVSSDAEMAHVAAKINRTRVGRRIENTIDEIDSKIEEQISHEERKSIYDRIVNSPKVNDILTSDVSEKAEYGKKILERIKVLREPSATRFGVKRLWKLRKDVDDLIPWDQIASKGASAEDKIMLEARGEISKAIIDEVERYGGVNLKSLNKEYQKAVASESLTGSKLPYDILGKQDVSNEAKILRVFDYVPVAKGIKESVMKNVRPSMAKGYLRANKPLKDTVVKEAIMATQKPLIRAMEGKTAQGISPEAEDFRKKYKETYRRKKGLSK